MMRELFVLMQKEFIEMIRNYKIIWMPLLFISFGIMQPLTAYYLSDILKEFGGLPEGAIVEIPLPTSPQIFIDTLSQFSQLGNLIVVLALMGMLAGERTSGAAHMILTKPVSYTSYFLSKWIAAFLLIILSYLAGILSAIYYIHLLFEPLSWTDVFISSSFYILWLLFIVSITLMFSALLKKTTAVAAVSILLILGFSVLPALFIEPLKWSPGNLMTLAGQSISGESLTDLFPIAAITILLIMGMISTAIQYMKRREWLR
ncbi:ABC transporter permease [Jeotgalibacillus proteolyticus]|uniref:ABC transporter permease n=1 Tax=Jeotgalibacillus proteolyticus TaxID=2082395 RepID=A0A2S5G652_9BACL|nr:ABC transporter permease subunit [Jeotgalibacillus proteolyticus]PPA68456.1 ABC transporter permease [Jeotgalibacillus proteolyticus]